MAFGENTIFADPSIKKKYRDITKYFLCYWLVSMLFSFNSKLEPDDLKMVHYFIIIAMAIVHLRLNWLYQNKKEKLM